MQAASDIRRLARWRRNRVEVESGDGTAGKASESG